MNTPVEAKTADEKKKNSLISDDVELPDRDQDLLTSWHNFLLVMICIT